jgi:NAD(P)-dependent dehydrogenase (short-subunit alcohol dehydrogenase family)
MTITLITGANKGLGRETARRLLEIDHTVLIGARDAERRQRTADELGGVFLEIDPTSDAIVAAAAQGRPDRHLSRSQRNRPLVKRRALPH